MRSPLFLVALVLAATCDAASLVRFINMVPTNAAPADPFASSVGSITNNVLGRVALQQSNIDRIGLYYQAPGVQQTVMWTTIIQPADAVTNEFANGASTQYAFSHSTAPLRQYHSVQSPFAGMIDRVAAYDSSQINGALNPAEIDNYEQSYLGADGVGLYLSFAAGQYTFQPYATLASGLVDYATTPVTISGSASSVQLQDNRVYSIVAIGSGNYGSSTTGNTVKIVIFEENTASTTFGKASIRFFNGIRTTDSINVFQGATATGTAVVSSVAFGSLSNYIDVAPNVAQTFTLTAGGSAIAPLTSGRTETTHDLRAGLRATVFCGYNSEKAASAVFCRMIPSRVVAYVRLINDLAGNAGLNMGSVGLVAYSRLNLTLWASYEFPQANTLSEASQVGGGRSVLNHPNLMRGLYKAVNNVAVGTVSGYGEVWVPVPIMDFAIKNTIIRDSTADGLDGVATPSTGNGAVASSINLAWYYASPIFKRVNMVVRSDAGATLSAGGVDMSKNFASTSAAFNSAYLLDTYMEIGEYYTIAVTSAMSTSNTAASVISSTSTISSVNPRGADIRFLVHRDRSVQDVSAGVTSGNGIASLNVLGGMPINNVATNYQTYSTGTLNIRISGNTNPTSTITGVAAGAASSFVNGNLVSIGGNTGAPWNTATNTWVTVPVGSYAVDYTAPTTIPAVENCKYTIPALASLTVSDGDVIDFFVLGTYNCLTKSTSNTVSDLTLLTTVAAKTASAIATGHDANTIMNPTSTVQASVFFAAAPALSASLSMVIAAIFAAVALLL